LLTELPVFVLFLFYFLFYQSQRRYQEETAGIMMMATGTDADDAAWLEINDIEVVGPFDIFDDLTSCCCC
jgi:hypothetical protein